MLKRTKYHLKDNGDPAPCTAHKRGCPKGEGTPHFSSPEAARAHFEKEMEAEQDAVLVAQAETKRKEALSRAALSTSAAGRAANRREADERDTNPSFGTAAYREQVLAHFDKTAPYELRQQWEKELNDLRSDDSDSYYIGQRIDRWKEFQVQLGKQLDRGELSSSEFTNLYVMSAGGHRSRIARNLMENLQRKKMAQAIQETTKELDSYRELLGKDYSLPAEHDRYYSQEVYQQMIELEEEKLREVAEAGRFYDEHLDNLLQQDPDD